MNKLVNGVLVEMTPDEIAAREAEEAAAAAAQQSAATDPANSALTMRQLRLGLKRFGDKPASFIQDTINAIPNGDAKDEAQIWYEETEVVHWDHPQTQALLALSGIPTDSAKSMWLAAKDIA